MLSFESVKCLESHWNKQKALELWKRVVDPETPPCNNYFKEYYIRLKIIANEEYKENETTYESLNTTILLI